MALFRSLHCPRSWGVRNRAEGRCRRAHGDHIAAQLCQLPAHILFVVTAKDLRIGVYDQLPAVLMPLPLGDELAIYSGLPQPADEMLAQAALAERGGA